MFYNMIHKFGLVLKHISKVWVPVERLLEGFEPIVESRRALDRIRNRPKYVKQNILPCVLTAYVMIDTLICLYTVGYDPMNPVLFNHVFIDYLDEFFRRQTDVIFWCAFSLVFVAYHQLIFDRMNHSKYILFLDNGKLLSVDNNEVPKKLSEKLLKMKFSTKSILQYWAGIIEFQANLAVGLPQIGSMIYKRIFVSGYQLKFRYLFFVPVSILFLHYYIAVIVMGFLFIFTNLNINIKQRFYIGILDKISGSRSYKHYKSFLRTLLKLVCELEAYNCLYARIITASILAFCLMGCSCLNGTATRISNLPFFLTIPWIGFSVLYLAAILIFAAVSSKTIQLNQMLYLRLYSAQKSILSSRIALPARQIIHLNLANEYKTLLHQTCFRLVTSAPLNNEFIFFNIFFIVSFTYLKVIYRE